jgi:hypothetical protein
VNSNNDPNHAPLRDVAQNPEATARYLADVQRVLLDIGSNLETLANETRIHLRDTHVEGDRFYHARLRARPVEKALGEVLKHLKSLTEGLESSAYKRRAHDENVANTARERKEKALEKARKNAPPIPAAPPNPPNPPQDGARGQNARYSVPTSIYDLGNRESA